MKPPNAEVGSLCRVRKKKSEIWEKKEKENAVRASDMGG
jgi:hypothetical protein